MGRGWDSSLFDRTEILATLAKRFTALPEGYRQNVALIGAPGIGKTAIIGALLNSLRSQPQIVPIYLELRPESFERFADRWMGSLLCQALLDTGMAASPSSWVTLAHEAQRRCPRAALRVEALRHAIANRTVAGKSADDLFSQLLELPGLVAADLGRCLLLIVEEFHHLEGLGMRRPFHLLGKQLMVDKSVAYLVTSSDVKASLLILRDKLDLLFGRFEIIDVAPFDTAASLAFLRQRLGELEMSPELQAFLVMLCGGHPWYLETVSARLRDTTMRRHTTMVTRDGLWESLGELMQDPHGALAQAFAHRVGPLTQGRARQALVPLLLAVANGAPRVEQLASAVRQPAKTVAKDLSRLMELGFVQRFGVLYTITDALFRWWVARVYRAQAQSWAPLRTDTTQRFKALCDGQLAQFVTELGLPLPERLVELFRAFRGDEIALNGDPRRRVGPFQDVASAPWGADGCQLTASTGARQAWVCGVKRSPMVEEDVTAFLDMTRAHGTGVGQRILVALSGIDLNARLRAKEARIWMWDTAMTNILLGLYGKAHLIP
ncbi:MAG: ATP-binding protein [Candidatus Omnitrophica bacterium]|nr:ATP-binding protein [Candidatus Omnitrophota bacterium]